MATIFSLLGSLRSQISSDNQLQPEGFVPLNADQMSRIKGGYDTEGDPGDDVTGESDPDESEDPLAGDPPVEGDNME